LVSFELIVSFFVSGLLEIVVPLLIALFLWRRHSASWRIFFIGCTMFIVSLIRIPLNTAVMDYFGVLLPAEYIWLLFYGFPSLTAGVFEESARFISFKLLIKEREVKDGLMYGAGHGGMESILLVGINTLFVSVVALLYPGVLSFEQVLALESIPAWLPLVGLFERMVAIAIQLGLSALVLQSVSKRKPTLFASAILIHFLVNVIAQYTLQYGIYASEGVTALFAVAFAYYIYRAMSVKPAQAASPIEGNPTVPIQ
jgi:uncharacterized membrane protein YhfC